MSRRTTWTLLATAGLALAMPAAAQAAKRTVLMGTPPANQKTFEKISSDVNAFFPSNVRIRTGDTVAFTPVGFHSVDLPAKGGRPLGLIAPTGKKVAGVTDAAGVPFWFNGLDELGFTKLLLKSGWGKTFSQGAGRVTSGAPLGDKLKPLNVRFSRAGLFTYYCNVHSGMKGTVRVVAKSKPAPSPKAVANQVKAQVAAALKNAKGLAAATKPPANTISVGAEGRNGVTHLGFLPDKLTVAVGTTVRFAMPTKTTEVHTATAGPGNPLTEPKSYLGTIAGSFTGVVFDPRATYPSEQPPAIGALSPALHGNGFWSTGVMDSAAASPLPPAGAVTFAAAGTYELFCMIHPFMKGTIAVQ